MTLEAYVHDGCQVGTGVKDLFTVEEAAVDGGSSELEFITHSRRKSWPPESLCSNPKCMEADIMVELCREIFLPLCREVLLESRYASRIFEIPELQVGQLGLGSLETWHGTPHARLRGIEIVCQKGLDDSSAFVEVVFSNNEESDGTSTPVEG